MVKCSECKFWRFIRSDDFIVDDETTWKGPHGECNKITDTSYDEVEAWVAPQLACEDVDTSLITKPDFGCILGENKNGNHQS